MHYIQNWHVIGITFELHQVTCIYAISLKVAEVRFNYQVREVFCRKMFSPFYSGSFKYLQYHGHLATI